MLLPPSDRSRAALEAICENATRALAVHSRNSPSSFEASWEETYLAIRCLEIISEASRRLEPEVLERRPGLPWRQIRDIGNTLRHGYDAVLPDRIWRVLEHDLEALLAAVKAELLV